MKKQMIILILVSMMIDSSTQIFAIGTSVKDNAIQYIQESDAKSIKLAEDVFIEGLYEGAVLYVGAEIRVKGSVDQQATQKNITWQITGNNGIIDFRELGNNAQITGENTGTVWVMARAMDGSDRAREYTVNVKNYPADATSQSLVSGHITPILRRPFENSGSILQLEVSKSLVSAAEREKALKTYIKKLASKGEVSNQGSYSDEHYEYYIINTNNAKIEVRLSKNDVGYFVLKKILMNVSEYANGNGEAVQRPEEPVKPQEPIKPEEPIKPQKPVKPTEPVRPSEEKPKLPIEESITGGGNETTQGVDNMIILGGSGTSVEDPLVVTLQEHLTSQEKVAQMKAYLGEIGKKKRLGLIRKRENAEFASYTLKISERNAAKEGKKNDFFIDIRVKKEDEEAYVPIIEMLDNIEKDNLKGGENEQVTPENKENYKDDNSQSNGTEREEIKGHPSRGNAFQKDNILDRNYKESILKKNNQIQIFAQGGIGSLKEEIEAEIYNHKRNEKEFLVDKGYDEKNKNKDEAEEGETIPYRFKSLIVFLSLGVAWLIKNSL